MGDVGIVKRKSKVFFLNFLAEPTKIEKGGGGVRLFRTFEVVGIFFWQPPFENCLGRVVQKNSVRARRRLV